MTNKYFIGISVIIIVAILCLIFSCNNTVNENSRYRTDTAQISAWINSGNNIKFKMNADPNAGDSGRVLFQKAIRLSQQIDYGKGVVWGYLYWGSLEARLGKYPVSRRYLDSALAAATKYRYDSFTARIYRNIATTYFIEENYNEGSDYLLKAIELFERDIPPAMLSGPENSPNVHYLMIAYHDLGTVFHQMEQYDKALYYSKKSIALARNKKDYQALSLFMVGIGGIYRSMDSFNTAETTEKEALALTREHRFPNDEENSLRILGEIYTKTNPAIAMPYLEQSLTMARKMSSITESISLLDIGKLFLVQHQYGPAESFLKKAAALSEKLSSNATNENIHEQLSEVYYGQKKYKEAFDEQVKFLSFKDTLEQNENRSKIRRLEIQYRTAEKDKKIAERNVLIASQDEKLFRKNIWIAGAMAFLVLSFVFFTLLFRGRQRVQAEKLKTFKKEEKINMLLSVMKGEEKERSRLANELHDGIGGLLSTVKMYFNNVQSKEPALIISPEYKEAMALLDQTLAELRKTAHNLMPEALLKNELPEALRQLCSTIQNANSLKVSFQYYGFIERLNTNFELFIYRIVQELLQNIVKHAHATEAIVQISIHNDIFSITVEDNGVGIRENEYTEGMGLKTIRSRVEEINGSFMVSSGKQNGTSVYIEIDIKNNEKFDLFTATLHSGKLSEI